MNTLLFTHVWLSVLMLVSTTSSQLRDESRVYISQDHGVSWSAGDSGLPENDGVNVLILHNKRAFAGTNSHGIWAMEKHGWYVQSNGLPKQSRVISLLSYNHLLFAGLYFGGLYYSADDGTTWHPVGNRQQVNVRAIAGHAGVVYVGTDDAIYTVDIRTGHWQRVLGGQQINSLASGKQFVYAGTHKGVVRSINGFSWEPVYRGGAVSKVVINSDRILLMDYSGNVLSGDEPHPLFIKDDVLLPHSYLQLTPASPKILGGEWCDPGFGHSASRKGLPNDVSLGILLQTPFGLLAARSAGGC